MMRRLALAAVAGTLASGCFDFSMASGLDGNLDGVYCPSGCIEFMPLYSNHILAGDTVRLVTHSTSGHDHATWSVTGNAVGFLAGSTLTTQIGNDTTSTLVKAVEAGSGEVTALSRGLTARITFRVADSTVITQMDLRLPSEIVIARGGSIMLVPDLKDAANIVYRARPTWTSSDTTVVGLSLQGDLFYGGYTVAWGRKAGRADLTATFRNLTRLVRVTVP